MERLLNLKLLLRLWTVRAVKGSVQVLWVDRQLSNLDFWVRLQKGSKDNKLWSTNKRDPVRTDHLARAAFRFWCVPLSLLACWQELVFVVWFLSANQVGPQCKIFCSSCVKCATSTERVVCLPHVGFLSNFQQFLLWLCAVHWCKLIWNPYKVAWKGGIFYLFTRLLFRCLLRSRKWPHSD